MADKITSEYDGKKVVITLASEKEPFEARVEAHTDAATIFKRKGKLNSEFEPASNITDIRLAAAGETKIKRSRLDPVTLSNIKRHLVDRHGFPVSQIEGGSPEALLEWHNAELNHADLSHFHEVKAAAESKANAE